MESVNARRSGTQPRPSSKGDFPWTYGHPGRDYDVSIVPQAAYTEFAVRRRTFFKPPRKHDTFGIMHKTMKGNIVLLASTQAVIRVPKHSDLRRCLASTYSLCDILPDGDWFINERRSTTSSVNRSSSSSSDDDNYASPSASKLHRRIFPTRSTTDGSSPLVNGDTLAEIDGACSEYEGDGDAISDSASESCTSDSNDEAFDGGWETHVGVDNMPTPARPRFEGIKTHFVNTHY
jgi:hypothetical protein